MTKLNFDQNYFAPLTGVTALAAYMVFFHHFNPFSVKYSHTFLFHFVQELHVGVTFFFVLSGFLIAFKYMDMINFNFKTYMIRRLARTYPMYFILTSITFIFFAFQENIENSSLVDYLMNITFLKGYFNPLKFSGIGQGWSLTVEETFTS